MTIKTKDTEAQDRAADLYYAQQMGHSAVRENNFAALKAEFVKGYGTDQEALEYFNAGVDEESACRTALGMTPGQYQKHYAAKVQALADRRDAIHAASLGR
ncbi:hypothetical protein G0D98_19530 [Pseudomonas savastanoi pv. phaseolicola]|uniref:hypothetical protein n=1 Tax=Pseudomonas savastanoi TaxID=29438 RepID=UPI0002E343E2|nr:hypothetical protein [Pseudomonas savastanoi]MBN3470657.1 hypothetical protein [Pseudomonas savastanoi pv. phaseolicola]MBN3477683.1 hypothetical protein [Pseudomonas savastanoi pv. phaseolicola]